MATRGNPPTPGNPVRSQINPEAAKGFKKGNAPAIAQKRKRHYSLCIVLVPGSLQMGFNPLPVKKLNSWDFGPSKIGFNPLPVASARRPIHIRVTVFSGCDTR
jgi:hypothetical protein